MQVCQPSDTNSNCGGGGSGLTVGTTTIANGTNGYVEYNNNGVLGEEAVSGTGTVTSITFSSPLTGGTITGSGTVGITANTFDAYGAASAITLAGLGGTTLAAAEAAITPTELGLVIGTNVLAQRTFGTAANNNTGDFLASGGTAANSAELGGQLPSYYLHSYSETDPVFSTWQSSYDHHANWDTAYGWGNPSGVYLPLAGGTLTGDLALTTHNITMTGSLGQQEQGSSLKVGLLI